MKLKNGVGIGMLLRVTLCAFTLLSESQAAVDEAANGDKEYFGKYFGLPVKAEWLVDGRKMKLSENLIYEDPNSVLWIAPKGVIVDGASIPRIAWRIIGTPFTGKYRVASVIHDVACDEKKRYWKDVHLAFYNAMRASGVSWVLSNIMYGAVYHFGPRWPMKIKVSVLPQLSPKSMAYHASMRPQSIQEQIDLESLLRRKDLEKDIEKLSVKKIQVVPPKEAPILSSRDYSSMEPQQFQEQIDLESLLRRKDLENNIELSVKIPPPEKTLTPERFDELVALIKKSQESGSPLSLEQIQAYK